MADFRVFWRDFVRETRLGIWPCLGWRTNAERLGSSSPGDRVWIFTDGARCQMENDNAGYLVEILTVARVVDEGSDEGRRYLVEGKPKRCLMVDPPLLVDEIVRPPERDRSVPIGTFLQGARCLSEDKLDQLMRLIRHERPGLWKQLGRCHRT